MKRWSMLALALACGCGDGDRSRVVRPEVDGDATLGVAIADSALGAAVAEALRAVGLTADSAHLDCLTTLSAAGRGVEQLDGIGALRRLRSLDLSQNRIGDLGPLAGLDSLRFLDLSFNSVADISALAGLAALRVVSLEHNQVADLTALAGLDWLQDVALTGNPLAESQVRALAARGVRVTFGTDVAPEVEDPLPPDPAFGVFRFVFRGYRLTGKRILLWVGSTDLTEPTPVYDDLASYGSFSWAPDGRRFAFRSNRGDALGTWYRAYVGALGSEPVPVTDWFTDRYDFKWSPDGARIAYVQGRGGTSYGGIALMSPDGGDERLLTDPAGARDGSPVWSPDGGAIAFVRIGYGDSTSTGGLFVADMGTGQTRCLDAAGGGRAVEVASWSPKGGAIAYSVWEEGVGYRIQAVDPHGDRPPRVLFAEGGYNDAPQWSPDGTKIAFVSDRDMPGVSRTGGDVFVMDADGGNPTKISESDGLCRAPSFSPDGTLVAYESDRSGFRAIHIRHASGAGGDLNITAGLVELPSVGPYGGVRWQP